MASRLQQFATRNQKQIVEPNTVKHSASRKAGNIRHARTEPTLLDTDVESIGNATNLSFADFDEDPEHEDARPDLNDDTISLNRITVNQEPFHHDSSSGPQARRPPRWQLGFAQNARPGWKDGHSDPDIDHCFDEQGPQEAARLDDVSSLPDSSQNEHSTRDVSPSPQSSDPDATPKRNQLYEGNTGSPHGALRQPLNQTKSQTLPIPKIRPSTGQPGAMQTANQHQQSNAPLLDYSPTTLDRMPYSQLAEEPFERDPAQAEIDAGGAAGTDRDTVANTETMDATTVAERLRVIAASEEDDTARHMRLAAFFAQLSLEQYEMAGDAILEQFGAVFRSFQEIRQRKRAVAIEFERKVADREAAVRGRHDALDRNASWLKRQGEDFIRGGPRD